MLVRGTSNSSAFGANVPFTGSYRCGDSIIICECWHDWNRVCGKSLCIFGTREDRKVVFIVLFEC